jgi:hypothetical protein
MFDTEGGKEGDAVLLAVMAEAQRDERVAVARRLLAAGRLCQLRMADVDAEERFQWCVDNWEAVAAEVGAELGISRRRASTQMNYGVELLERLPKLGAAFAAGEVDFRVVAVAVFRTGLITDEDVLTAIDARLAAAAPRWNAYSNARIAELVDWWVREADPAAERNARSSDADRNVTIGPTRDGLTEFWGTLRAPDAAALDRGLTKLTATVCRNDPRTLQQRRADAMAVLTAGGTSMVCGCESADCPKREAVAEPGQIVIHLMAEAATVAGKSDAPGYLPGHGAIRCCAQCEVPGSSRPSPATDPRRHWRTSSGTGTCAAGSPAATSPPRSAISTTPCPMAAAGPRIRPTWLCSVVFIISSKRSCAAKKAGGKSNSQMAPSSGPRPRAALTPPSRAARCSSRNWPTPAVLSSQLRAGWSPRGAP